MRPRAVTTRTLTVEPREGHFSTRDDYSLGELPGLLRRYGRVLRRTDGGWVNAFGWCNVGIEAYLRDFWSQAQALHAAGVPADEAARRIDMRAQTEHYPAITTPGVLWHGVARAYEILEGRAE